MRIAVGILCLALWLVYLGQAISVVNLRLAQRLGLQEKPEGVDALFVTLEQWVARWDLWWLWTLPAAGILMLVDHPWWPYAAMIGGGAHVDTGGREAAKMLGLRQQSVRIGTRGEQQTAMIVFAAFIAIGSLAIAVGLVEVI